jgi:hypothetical protein
MSMSGLRTGWHGPAACRISSLVMLHFARLCAMNSCTPRAFGALQVRVALSVPLSYVCGDGCNPSKEVWWELGEAVVDWWVEPSFFTSLFKGLKDRSFAKRSTVWVKNEHDVTQCYESQM